MESWAPDRGHDAFADVFAYISSLSLDDIDTLQSHAPGGSSTLSDEELAMALFAQEAAGLLNIAKEHAGQSTRHNRSIIEELEEMEALARYDHQVALAIAEDRPIPPMPALPLRRAVSEPDAYDSAEDSDFGTSDSESDTDASSVTLVSRASSSLSLRAQEKLPAVETVDLDLIATSLRPTSPISLHEDTLGSEDSCASVDDVCEQVVHECTICCDDIDGQAYEAPCGHFFDTQCLEAMFRKATVDESLFPPKCCQLEIPPQHARERLNCELMVLFDRKAVEFGTKNKLYCSEPRCSAFIGPATDEVTWMECPECSSMTCGFCKSSAHPGTACSDTDDLKRTAKEMREKQGWQRCYSCHHMVELTVGCYHIICTCHAQFCYLCGAKWKQCDCPQFAVPPDII